MISFNFNYWKIENFLFKSESLTEIKNIILHHSTAITTWKVTTETLLGRGEYIRLSMCTHVESGVSGW